ncbi:MAG: hypothetical protein M0025_02445 [Elusimicrobia bacterium]|nr:hypothetical protein [Elusimicrobiota bacterium]
MFNKIFLFAVLICATSTSYCFAAPAAEGCLRYYSYRISAKDWRVRYALAVESNNTRCVPRSDFEKLIRDGDARVSNQALVAYLYRFAIINSDLVREHLEKLPIGPLAGGKWSGGQDYKTVKFQVAMLDNLNIDNPHNGERIEYIGILGSKSDKAVLLPFLKATNEYVLYKLALAFVRLGDKETGMTVLKRILQFNPETSLYYQTKAVYILDELDGDAARKAYATLAEAVQKSKSIQPGNYNEHFIQGLELRQDLLTLSR